MSTNDLEKSHRCNLFSSNSKYHGFLNADLVMTFEICHNYMNPYHFPEYTVANSR